MSIIIDILFSLIFELPIVRILLLTLVPALALFFYIRHRDELEPESPRLVWSLFGLGAAATVLSYVLEAGGAYVLLERVERGTFLFDVVHWFLVVGLVEEGSKYALMCMRTWKNPEFNCMFDGVVYAVAVSAGFALVENVMYLFRYGPSVVMLRALVSVPGHICFAVFMGAWSSAAKKHALQGKRRLAVAEQWLALLIPTVMHGLYDFFADKLSDTSLMLFFGFVILMFIGSWLTVRKLSREDDYISTAA